MSKKLKVSEKELENVNGGHERYHGNHEGESAYFICSKCGAKCYIPECETSTRWEGCDGITTAACSECGTWDDIR